jgi:uncharacterized protein (DUF4415 family)
LTVNFAGRTGEIVETLVQQARALTDEDRRELARARKAIDETFHAGAWRAAKEMVTARAEVYTQVWVRIGSTFVPDRLEELVQMGSAADPEVVAEWQEVARLVRVGIDDALLALLTADSIPPPNIRELYGPWKAMLEAAHRRRASEAAS